MVVDLLIVLICLVITGFGWLAISQDGEFNGGSLFQLVKWVYIYGFMIVAVAIPLIAVVLGYKYLLASGY
ncbi:hypothetical protein N8994_01235 [Gammaproteobacteria bacterium]|nr:hypothetical protein [Gammaproteobacteria bacterium]